MTLEEKFYKYLEVNTNYAVPTIEKWSKELAKITEKYYVGEVKLVLRVDKLEQQLEEQKQFTYTNAMVALKFKEENEGMKETIDKLKNETFECDTCLDVCYQNEKLEKENAELKTKLLGGN